MTILIVEDSKTARSLIKREFEGTGYTLLEAATGSEALTTLAKEKVSLITMDLGLPDMSGFDVCEKLRNASHGPNASTPIIFLTASDDIECRTRGFDYGATDFLGKNFIRGQLIAATERILNASQRLAGCTALVVDDSRSILTAVKQVLEQEGMSVLTANSGPAAFEILKEKGATLDLLVTDHEMPEMTGLELCRRARTILGLRELPIVFLSGSNEKRMGLEFFQAGATDFVEKPFCKEVLLARICGHMEARILVKRLAEHSLELTKLNNLKDQFLSICSHDLQSPLGSIIGFGRILSEEVDFPEKYREEIIIINQAAEHLSNLVHNLLDLTKFQAADQDMPMETLDLNQIVTDSVRMLAPMAAGKGIALTSESIGATYVAGNSLSLARILSNLTSNAIKFTNAGGSILIKCANNGKGNAILSVTDTGVGMDPDKIKILFDRFSKASTKGTAGEKGTGLGMSITRDLVEAHRGKITVGSRVGVGTTISVIFPEVAA